MNLFSNTQFRPNEPICLFFTSASKFWKTLRLHIQQHQHHHHSG